LTTQIPAITWLSYRSTTCMHCTFLRAPHTQCDHLFKISYTLVHRSLHNAGAQYLSSLLDHYCFALPPSISSPILVSTLLLPLVVFDMLALLFGIPSIPHHLRSTDSYTVFKYNLKLTFSLVQASLAASNFDPFCVLKSYYVMLCYVMLCHVTIGRYHAAVRVRMCTEMPTVRSGLVVVCRGMENV